MVAVVTYVALHTFESPAQIGALPTDSVELRSSSDPTFRVGDCCKG